MISKRIIGFIFFLIIGATMNAQTKKYFIHLTSDPIKNPSAALMSIHAASEALSQGHVRLLTLLQLMAFKFL